MKRIIERTAATAGIIAFGTIATATRALADYPPTPSVEGTTVRTVSTDPTTAFTGANVGPWLVAGLVLLAVGIALLAWARSSARTSARG
jgi:hypothetical protein